MLLNIESKRLKHWCGICQGRQGRELIFEKNKQTITYAKQAQMKKPKDEKFRSELILGRTHDKSEYHCANRML